MMIFKMLQYLIKGSHYIELVCAKRIISTTESLIRDFVWNPVISNFLFFLIT